MKLSAYEIKTKRHQTVSEISVGDDDMLMDEQVRDLHLQMLVFPCSHDEDCMP